MSVTRWILLLVTAGMFAMLAVFSQHGVTRLSYEKTQLQQAIRRLDEEKAALKAQVEAIVTPDALAEHAKKFNHLVPPGREN